MLTAEELSLTDEQYTALHSTLAALKAGTIVHLEQIDELIDPTDRDDLLFFNMTTWTDDVYAQYADQEGGVDEWGDGKHCGSVCCIGGTAEFIMKKSNLFEYNRHDEEIGNYKNYQPLHFLFYPWDDKRWGGDDPEDSEFTLENAIQALTNYLQTGDSNWPAVIEAYRKKESV